MAGYSSLTDPLRQKVDERFKREFRFNPRYEETIRSVNERLAGLTSQEEHGRRRFDEDYSTNMTKLGEGHEKGITSLQERLANQGILRSGINVGEQARMGGEYQKAQGELGTQKARGIEDMVRELTGQRQGIETERRLAEADRGREEVDFRDTLAREESQREADEAFRVKQAEELEALRTKITELSQPKPAPTGQLIPPPPPPQMPRPMPQMPAYRPPPMPTVPRASGSGSIQAMGIDPVDLQKHLQIRGFDPGPIDGNFGAKSQRALIMWKQSVGLPANIDFDPNVWNTLRSTGVGQPTGATPPMPNAPLGRLVPNAGPARRGF